MKHILILLLLVNTLFADDKIKTLIISGQNNHNWKATTPEIVKILEDTGKFEVEITEEIEKFPVEKFDEFDVIVSNWNLYKFKKKGVPKRMQWSEELKKAYVDFVKNGKGHVALHAGSSTFYDWEDYQKICIATWKDGTNHGPIHEFEVRIDNEEHPVTKGLKNFQKRDELWQKIYISDPEAKVLTSSFSAKKYKGHDLWEKSTLVSKFGEGRTAYASLGHDQEALTESSELRTLIARLVEWAAKGKVSEK